MIPPTFLTTAMLLWEPPDQPSFAEVGFEPSRVLHGAEEYRFHGPPPRVGDVLHVTSRITDRYEKHGKRGGLMRFATFVHEFRDGNGTLVAEQRSTALETSASDDGGKT